MTVGGAVLTGGASRRMGRDKANIRLDGTTLLERAAAALTAAGVRPVVVVGGDTGADRPSGLTLVADQWPGEGPLGGLITALDHLSTDLVVVLPCDLLSPSPTEIGRVIEAIGTADVAVPILDGRAQWLHAVWRREAMPTLRRAFEQGVRAPRLAVDDLRVQPVETLDRESHLDADEPNDLPPNVS